MTDPAFARQDWDIDLSGPEAMAKINMLSLCGDDHVHDMTLLLSHLAPHCVSEQNIRMVVTDRAQTLFRGKIGVDKIAQKTNGYQLSKALLLSPTARVNTKPELEIYADDVKCSHGATSGQLDPQALHYMRSRG